MGGDLYADGAGSCGCDAGLRPIGAVHSVIFGGFSPEAVAGPLSILTHGW